MRISVRAIVWDRNKAIDIRGWAICGCDRLERFHCTSIIREELVLGLVVGVLRPSNVQSHIRTRWEDIESGMYVRKCVFMYIYMCVCVCVCMNLCIYECMWLCMYVCLCICVYNMHVCMYVCICMHVDAHESSKGNITKCKIIMINMNDNTH